MKRVRLGVCSLLLFAAASLGEIDNASGNATGCSRYEDRTATINGCRPYPGDACYRCEYSYGGSGGYSVCSETPDGETKFCTDYQDIPPPW